MIGKFDGAARASRLPQLLAAELRALLRDVPVGGRFLVTPSENLCSSLELFVPACMRAKFPEWEKESIDGFFVARAIKSGPEAASLSGTCILIRDQTVTPFTIQIALSPDAESVASYRMCVGEPGGGALGISGPMCNSRGARRMLETLEQRLDDVAWVYVVEAEGESA